MLLASWPSSMPVIKRKIIGALSPPEACVVKCLTLIKLCIYSFINVSIYF